MCHRFAGLRGFAQLRTNGGGGEGFGGNGSNRATSIDGESAHEGQQPGHEEITRSYLCSRTGFPNEWDSFSSVSTKPNRL